MSEQTSLSDILPGADARAVDDATPAFATFATTDGRLLRINPREHVNGGIELLVGGRAPVSLDRYQLIAFVKALHEMVEAQ